MKDEEVADRDENAEAYAKTSELYKGAEKGRGEGNGESEGVEATRVIAQIPIYRRVNASHR